MMPVEYRRAIVLGVHYKSEGRWGGAQRTLGRVDEQGTTESTAANRGSRLANVEISIQHRLTAIEYSAIMRFGQRFHSERSGHEPNNLRWRLAARRRATLGAGGWRMASANRR